MDKVLKTYKEKTTIKVQNVTISNDTFTYIAGPCSVESFEQLNDTAQAIKQAGAHVLRGGAFKPRTSPYSFQGLGGEGIEILSKVSDLTNMPIISEITSESQIELFTNVDIIQIGARNMQNYELLKAVGKLNKPVLLKRGLSATVEEWLNAAEYIMSEGNEEVILCERGIRTFETSSRFTLDLSSIPVLKELTHLPIIVDPSHAAGNRKYVKALAKAAAAVGCNGLIIETHINPECALSDKEQTISTEEFQQIVKEVDYIVGDNNEQGNCNN